MNTIYGHTETGDESNPGFMALTEESGRIRAVLRSRKSTVASTVGLSRDQLVEMHVAIGAYLLETAPQPAPTPKVKGQ